MSTVPHRPSLRIVHVLRAPVGGLFRHVLDLAAEQSRQGHIVGIICDSSTGGSFAEQQLDAIEKVLRLGVHRTPMARSPGLADLATLRQLPGVVAELAPDVIHGHGAKGGLYARMVRIPLSETQGDPARIYTPHGGSLHFSRATPAGFLFLAAERMMMSRSDAIIFESAFGQSAYARKVGKLKVANAVVHNGLRKSDFELLPRDNDATDFLFLGELRQLKGVDVLLAAMAQIWKSGQHEPTLTLVGDGPDADSFKAMAEPFGRAVRFCPPEPAHQALRRARCVVLPSRAESLPYVVLEGLACGRPVIAAEVGGVPEIFGEQAATFLVPPSSAPALADRLSGYLSDPKPFDAATVALRKHLQEAFSIEAMTASVLSIYGQALGVDAPLTADSFSQLNAY